MSDSADRKQRGAWYTPDDLVARVVEAAVTPEFVERCLLTSNEICIVDPACGDGRFLIAAAERIVALGGRARAIGVDIDRRAVDAARQAVTEAPAVASCDVVHADALSMDWTNIDEPSGSGFDLVIGNPPFLSQMAAATTRGGSSSRGGGPYADAAVEFVALAAELVSDSGRVAFVLPQSVLSARDAGMTRSAIDARADIAWSWWTGDREFDAHVHTCALVFQFGTRSTRTGATWGHVITDRQGVPDVPLAFEQQHAGRLGDRCWLNANFRDEYYGMIPAVGDHDAGPQLITSGLIDPGQSWWGRRPITFAKQRFAAPRLDLEALDPKMQRWASRRLVPKVLIANQTKIIEAVADPAGDVLPGVPVISAYPTGGDLVSTAWETAAVLTSPVASAWAWHRSAGTGLSADAIRLGPVVLADVPWPAGSLDKAVQELRLGNVRSCGREVHRAFGINDEALVAWWEAALVTIEARQPPNVTESPRQ
ncbi:MAG: N-6 DNA methylase [Actinomycetota bacterium]|nr:N-6 DNA methylase [Actinomycetota bacterium]